MIAPHVWWRARRWLFGPLSLIVLLAIYSAPAVAASAILRLPLPSTVRAALVIPAACLAFVVTAGLLSMPWQRTVRSGRFPRDLGHPVYFGRRMYGLCWTNVFYMKPLYSLFLSVPALKALMFRLFGYRGSLDFTIYPDTWIRDLPLLSFGPGTYIANRATLGTNIAFRNGAILVDRITLGDRCMVGHLTMIAPGVVLEDDAEVSVGCAIGVKARLAAGALVQPTCTVGHFVNVGARAVVGEMSILGSGAKIGGGLTLPTGSLVADRARIRTAADAATVVSSRGFPATGCDMNIRRDLTAVGVPG